MNVRRTRTAAVAAGLAAGVLAVPMAPAHAGPNPATMYQQPGNAQCNKNPNFCVLYPKAAALPSGRLVAAFERSIGDPVGQTMPVYRSDDNGQTWQWLSDVRAPAYMGGPARYTSNWTNPFLYVMPHTVGSLSAGTLVMATVVSGDDAWYRQNKQANPNWQPTGDGDRRDVSIALYKSTDSGASWSFVNIVATGGWQGGSAGNINNNISAANNTRQSDPLWEPYLMAFGSELIVYYSDENDWTGYNTSSGIPTLRGDNATAPDSRGQILVHKTWNGTSPAWSLPVVDVPGFTHSVAGVNQIGGGRPGMPNVTWTTNNQWMLTYEYFGGGGVGRHEFSQNPLNFHSVGGVAGTDVARLPVTAGSPAPASGGSPTLLRLPDGKIILNTGASGDVWVNASGSSAGAWTRQLTTMPASYSRNLTYVPRTGRVLVMGGVTTLRYADIDFGRSVGAYFKLVNRRSGKALGVLQRDLLDGASAVQWTDNGSPDQHWHVTDVGGGYRVLLNRNSGRSLGVFQGATGDGAQAVQWVETRANDQQWTLVPTGSYFKIVNRNSGKVLGVFQGSTADGANAVQWTDTGALDQQWALVRV